MTVHAVPVRLLRAAQNCPCDAIAIMSRTHQRHSCSPDTPDTASPPCVGLVSVVLSLRLCPVCAFLCAPVLQRKNETSACSVYSAGLFRAAQSACQTRCHKHVFHSTLTVRSRTHARERCVLLRCVDVSRTVRMCVCVFVCKVAWQ